jgi:NADP-dependent 3-hydroxy acid dehydrogenase YdfG
MVGKIVVITGAGSGIGRATAELFGRQGARLHLADVNGAAVEAVCASLTGATAHTVDCADPTTGSA